MSLCPGLRFSCPQAAGRRVYLLVGSHPHKRSNAAALMGIYCVLHLGMTPAEAYAPLRPLEPFTGFRDASCGVPTYSLPVQQVIAGMYRAKQVGLRGWGLQGGSGPAAVAGRTAPLGAVMSSSCQCPEQ